MRKRNMRVKDIESGCYIKLHLQFQKSKLQFESCIWPQSQTHIAVGKALIKSQRIIINMQTLQTLLYNNLLPEITFLMTN